MQWAPQCSPPSSSEFSALREGAELGRLLKSGRLEFGFVSRKALWVGGRKDCLEAWRPRLRYESVIIK